MFAFYLKMKRGVFLSSNFLLQEQLKQTQINRISVLPLTLIFCFYSEICRKVVMV